MPAVTVQPAGVSAAADEWVTFTVAVSGGKAPYTYRWQSRAEQESSWTDLPLNNPDYVKNADTASLRLRAASTDWDYGYEYRCRITDAAGAVVVTDTVTVSVPPLEAYPIQLQEKKSATFGWVLFDAYASYGVRPYTYQWYGGTSPTDMQKLENKWGQEHVTTSQLAVSWLPDKMFGPRDWYYCCVITDAEGTQCRTDTVHHDMRYYG